MLTPETRQDLRAWAQTQPDDLRRVLLLLLTHADRDAAELTRRRTRRPARERPAVSGQADLAAQEGR